MPQIQDEILFQVEVANAYTNPSTLNNPNLVVNTGSNHTIMTSPDFAFAHGFTELANYRLFVTDFPITEATPLEDIQNNIYTTSRSISEPDTGYDWAVVEVEDGEEYAVYGEILAIETPSTGLQGNPNNPSSDEIIYTLAATLWGKDVSDDSARGMAAGAPFFTYIIYGDTIYALSNPMQGIETYSFNGITIYGENSSAEPIRTLQTLPDYNPYENTIEYIQSIGELQNLQAQILDLEQQLAEITPDDGIGQSDVDNAYNSGYGDGFNESTLQASEFYAGQQAEAFQLGVESVDITIDNQDVIEVAVNDALDIANQSLEDSTSYYQNQIAEQQAAHALVLADFQAQLESQDADAGAAYELGMAAGISSVIPEDGINQTDVDAAYAQGAASVDITIDNQDVAVAAFQEGVESVDITIDNQDAYNEGYEAGFLSNVPDNDSTVPYPTFDCDVSLEEYLSEISKYERRVGIVYITDPTPMHTIAWGELKGHCCATVSSKYCDPEPVDNTFVEEEPVRARTPILLIASVAVIAVGATLLFKK